MLVGTVKRQLNTISASMLQRRRVARIARRATSQSTTARNHRNVFRKTLLHHVTQFTHRSAGCRDCWRWVQPAGVQQAGAGEILGSRIGRHVRPLIHRPIESAAHKSTKAHNTTKKARSHLQSGFALYAALLKRSRLVFDSRLLGQMSLGFFDDLFEHFTDDTC